MGFPGGSVGKESARNAGDLGSILGLGRCPGERNGYPLQYSCLENPMDRGAWWAPVHGVEKSRTWLSDFHLHFPQACCYLVHASLGGGCEPRRSSDWRSSDWSVLLLKADLSIASPHPQAQLSLCLWVPASLDSPLVRGLISSRVALGLLWGGIQEVPEEKGETWRGEGNHL